MSQNRTLTSAQVAAKLGCAPRTPSSWARAMGCPHGRSRRKGHPYIFNLAEVKAWLLKEGITPGLAGRRTQATLNAVRAGVTPQPATASSTSTGAPAVQPGPPVAADGVIQLGLKEQLAKTKRAWWLARREKVVALQAEASVVDRAESIRAVASEIGRAQRRLLGLAAAASATCAAESDPERVQRYLDSLVRAALRDLSGLEEEA